ncbi:acyltransferase family protein [Streptomyces lunaelactis]|uniref:acyltransferase family protein n=1 Tax=Streptomyces lunaelactis TaxID=1535768 RepID=UPI001584FC3F|nr:acyltransferase family protein [Streptomyces lunaelactis]NUK02754.1 acyltransferase family protein [Streptomyces lunaelactis]NUK09609.1 acyltransferase family protein [Streptomyces lunaelactis]NUK17289.1 acyltransferase family protein [Streptomyces lunaelactis]NUK21390.1 acyltransferase family protein [Streptomyces lunaelactis]NUK35868.1 acyltransferase family protein [Streptomyces lunaelactis]
MFHAPHGNQTAPLPTARESEPVPTTRQAHTQVVDAPAEKSAPKSASRDAYFDNAKYLAIVLVAVAHAWEPVMDGSRASRALYLLVYTFHMPAFILISGYFSRSYTGRPDQLRRLLTGIAVPYVVFEVVYSLFRRWAQDAPEQPISLLDPFYLTWFLAALFIWRLTAPLWRLIKWPVPVALTLASLATLTPDIGADLNLQRVLQFLPFFVLGLCLKPEHFQLVRRREARLLALPLFAGAGVFAYWASAHMNFGWLYRSSSAQELGVPWWAGIVMTLAFFGCAVLLTAGFLAWVPRRRTWFTVLGAGTICGYLLHGLLIKAADYGRVFEDYAWLSDPGGEIMLTLIAAAAVTLLCTPPVRRSLRWVTEPDMRWAFRRDATELGRPRR